MQLRPYQNELSRFTRLAVKEHRRVILQSPTGSGKSAVATDFVARAVNQKMKCVFLVDRKELLSQTIRHFNEFGIQAESITADTKVLHKADVYVGMVETFYRRYCKGWFENVKLDLFILDECHEGIYYKLIEQLPYNTFIIGLTATPVASSKNHPLKKFYNEIVQGPSTQWCIEQGWLVPSIDIGQNKLLEMKTLGGEFTSASQFLAFNKNGLKEKMFQLWKTHALDRQTLCYNINIEHNEQVCKMFIENGIDAVSISSESSVDDRENALEGYRNGRYQVLCNVGILTKGFDSPETSCIVGNFSTTSLSKWFQVIGRGGRPYQGKDNFITIDMGNNLLMHGSYNDEVDWVGIYNDEKRDKNAIPKKKPKLCPCCYAYLFNIHVRECHACNKFINPRELISLDDCMPEELKTKHPSLMTNEELRQYAKYKGYKSGWVHHQMMARFAKRQ